MDPLVTFNGSQYKLQQYQQMYSIAEFKCPPYGLVD